MKKLMILVAVATMTACGAERLSYKTSSIEDYRRVYAELLACTNNDEFSEKITKSKFGQLHASRASGARALLVEADGAFADKGFYAFPSAVMSWPRISALARAARGTEIAFPYQYALAKRLRTDADSWSLLKGGATSEDFIRIIEERIQLAATNNAWAIFNETRWNVALQQSAPSAVKKRLRALGKSFVTKNGINPCNAYLEPLNTALNAPRYSGLNAWIESMGYSIRISDNLFPSDEEVESIKSSLLSGDKDMTLRYKGLLKACLGIDGYNAFVREYNGE